MRNESRFRITVGIVVFVSVVARMHAQPPPMMNYQGRVSVDGIHFDGTGQFKFALMDGETGDTYWSHDGSSVGGSEPGTAIAIAVQRGLYAVPLGDITFTGMSEALSAQVFANPDVRLRVWFNDGEHGFRQLIPDQRVTSVAYAMMASDVAGGAWRLGGNAITTPGTDFIGTTDNVALELHVNGARVLRIEPDATSPRIVAGHASNVVSGYGATVSGGGTIDSPNQAINNYATVGGGLSNTVSGVCTTVGGGWVNTANCNYGTIGGGVRNIIYSGSTWTTIGGGSANTASGNGNYATIGGGWQNSVEDLLTTVSGGRGNRAIGSVSTIGGGIWNIASGNSATIPGGRQNTATNYAFAAGRCAKANHEGAFVWGDSTDADVASTANNQVTFRSAGGFRIFSNSGMTMGAQLAPNATSWTALSDREAKENFNPIDAGAILDALADMPVTAWNYKADADQRRYIGPVAQDFHAAFGLGSETRIATLDTDGVLFAAVQGLHARNEALQAENTALAADMSRISAENERLASELEAIKRHLGL